MSPASRVSFRNPLASPPAGSSLPTEVASDEDIDLNSGSEFHQVSQSSTGVYSVSPGHDPVVPLDHEVSETTLNFPNPSLARVIPSNRRRFPSDPNSPNTSTVNDNPSSKRLRRSQTHYLLAPGR